MVGPLLRVLVSVFAPIYWTTVLQNGPTRNGYSFTHGQFRQESQLEFDTGLQLIVIIHHPTPTPHPTFRPPTHPPPPPTTISTSGMTVAVLTVLLFMTSTSCYIQKNHKMALLTRVFEGHSLSTGCIKYCLGFLQPGEVLRLTHVARGLDSEGVLLIDIVINGYVPPSLTTSHLSLQVCPQLSL